MRDRLIEIFKNTNYKPFEQCNTEANLAYQFSDYALNCIVDKILENGVIVPPCKVDDVVYATSDSRIVECVCHEIIWHSKLMIATFFKCDYDCEGCPFKSWSQDYSGEYSCKGEYGDWFFSLNDFGKTVFLTREEAEHALKGRVKNSERNKNIL